MLIKVAIVEDDSDIRQITVNLIGFYSDLECVGAFASAEAFKEKLPSLDVHIVLMDIGLPQQNGIACIEQLHPQFPEIEFIMFTDHYDGKEVFKALSVGASGYVLKGGKSEQLVEAIREVVAGGSPMSHQISRMVIRSFQNTEPQFTELDTLTKQEREILNSLDKGWGYKEIAAQHFISENTVRSHIRNIYKKLEVHTRTEALMVLHGRR
jgi:two-component system, NarL family, response regulator LiaR